MRTLGWNILVLSFALIASAQVSRKGCSRPPEYPHAKLSEQFIGTQEFYNMDKVYYTCAEGFTKPKGSPWSRCDRGKWSRLALKCQRQCSVPATIQNSNANIADRYMKETSFPSGTKVSYVCDIGYVASGGFRVRMCKNGEWSPLLLKCERKSCGSAGEIPHGQFTYSGVQFGDTATAACNEGYSLVGRATRTCTSQGWDGRVPACEAVACDEPTGVTNAERMDPNEPPYTYRTVIRYRCRVGSLTGPRDIWCKEDGTWSGPPPTCTETTCPYPNVPNASWMEAPNGLYRDGDTVTIECKQGYTMTGWNSITCERNGQWSDLPKCTKAEPTCSTPVVANAVSSAGDVSVHRVGDYVSFTCGKGFQLDGAQQITCGPGGLWQPQPPRCLTEPSKDGQCSAPVTIPNSNANIADQYMKETSFASGSQVNYVCDMGYVASGGSRYRKCTKGQWSPLLLKCERKSCGSAGEIPHGQFTYTGVQFGDTATADCREGYSLVGRATRTCTSQGWDGRVPACEAVACDEPTGVTNAERMDPNEPPYTYRTVIRYRCRVGSLTGPRDIWCKEDGTWSGPPPTCTDLTCPPPNIPNAYWMEARNGAYRDGDTISVECKRGYTMTGWNSITCERNGQWSDLPKCTRRYTNWGY
ncbi:complement receptor type 1-like [Centropristis striata]|uniref:complement receptor type 1-like n=1 Tax=Centropristis striata TaxID=184440 RepID=UPI0027DF5435|nr:complement receptor type 1-like [Centropristis striata]